MAERLARYIDTGQGPWQEIPHTDEGNTRWQHAKHILYHATHCPLCDQERAEQVKERDSQ